MWPSIPRFKDKIDINQACSFIPTNIINRESGKPHIESGYERGEYSIDYTASLLPAERNYNLTVNQLPPNYRISSAGDERAIWCHLRDSGNSPLNAHEFDDLCGRNKHEHHMLLMTSTCLRVPDGVNAGQYEEVNGRKYWRRIVIVENYAVGNILVPEGGNSVVVSWYDEFGIPRITADNAVPDRRHAAHFSFSPEQQYCRYGFRDSCVVLRGNWPLSEPDGCIVVDACHSREQVLDGYWGVRFVRGPHPNIKSISRSINPIPAK